VTPDTAEKSHDPALLRIALSSAIIAVLAAVASLLSEHQVNEAMLAQLRASDQWSYYQAKGIKHNVLEGQIQILEAISLEKVIGKASSAPRDKVNEAESLVADRFAAMKAQSKKYSEEQEEISKEATKEQTASGKSFRAHNTLSYAVTLLQVAIGVSAVSALTRRRWLWITSMAVASVGLVFLAWGIARAFFLA